VADRASSVDDRSALALEAFADAVTVIPRTLARNAGADPIDALAALRNRHHDGETAAGVARSGAVGDMFDAGVVEPVAVPARCLSRLPCGPRASCCASTRRWTRSRQGPASPDDDTTDTLMAETTATPTRAATPMEAVVNTESGGHDGGYPWALSH